MTSPENALDAGKESALGNIEKDSKYRRLIESNTKENSHPRNQGIIMQAHHLISADAVKRSSIGHLMKRFGYDINCLNNLVLLPYTLESACHLEVQLHRGNHTSPAADELLDPDDRPHPQSYHDSVTKLLNMKNKTFSEKCEGADSLVDDRFRKDMHEISEEILEEIEDFGRNFQLTSIAALFETGSTGCCGLSTTPQIKNAKTKKACPHNRNHHEKNNTGLGKTKKIQFKKAKYRLKTGK